MSATPDKNTEQHSSSSPEATQWAIVQKGGATCTYPVGADAVGLITDMAYYASRQDPPEVTAQVISDAWKDYERRSRKLQQPTAATWWRWAKAGAVCALGVLALMVSEILWRWWTPTTRPETTTQSGGQSPSVDAAPEIGPPATKDVTDTNFPAQVDEHATEAKESQEQEKRAETKRRRDEEVRVVPVPEFPKAAPLVQPPTNEPPKRTPATGEPSTEQKDAPQVTGPSPSAEPPRETPAGTAQDKKSWTAWSTDATRSALQWALRTLDDKSVAASPVSTPPGIERGKVPAVKKESAKKPPSLPAYTFPRPPSARAPPSPSPLPPSSWEQSAHRAPIHLRRPKYCECPYGCRH